MIITDIKQNRSNKKFSIFVDEDFVFSITDVDVLYYKLEIGEGISPQKLEKIKEEVVLAKAKEKASDFISYKQRTEKEVRDKLADEEYTEDVIEEVVSVLIKYKYIDDEKYAENYIKTKSNYGSLRLKYELKQKGVSAEIISQATQGLDQEEIIVGLFQKKLKGDLPEDYKEKRKAFEYVIRRGFEYDAVQDGYERYKEEIEEQEE